MQVQHPQKQVSSEKKKSSDGIESKQDRQEPIQVIEGGPQPREQLQAQLESMDFEPELIQQALKHTNDLEQAVVFIIGLLESKEKQLTADKQKKALILLARTDLKMGTGKIAAQCAHATLKAFQQANQRSHQDDPYALSFIQWLETGKQIITYKYTGQCKTVKIEYLLHSRCRSYPNCRWFEYRWGSWALFDGRSDAIDSWATAPLKYKGVTIVCYIG